MRCLLASILLLLCCSISYGQTSVLIDVPPILPVPITDCDCVDCTCAPSVAVEVERTGLLERLRSRLGDKDRGGAKSCIVRFIIKRRLPPLSPPSQEEGVVIPPAPVRGEI